MIVAFPLHAFPQDFTGVWTGFIFTNNVRVQYELVISESNNKLTGYSLTVFNINNVENTGVKTMKLKAKRGKISIEDDDLIFNDYTQRSKRVVLYSTLSLEEEDSIFVLQGSFFTRSLDRSSYTGTIRLEKTKTFSEARMVPILKKMELWAALSIPETQPGANAGSPVSVAVSSEPIFKDSTGLKSEMTVTTTKPVNKSDVANLPDAKKEAITVGALPEATAKAGVVKNTDKEVPAVPKTINKSDVANLPDAKKEAITVGALPEGTTKPGLVSNTDTEVASVPKPINRGDVADLPGLKKEPIGVGALPGGVAKPGVAPRMVAEDIASRKTEVIRSIYVQSDSLVLSLYDNGEIDGDTVTVVVNDRVVIARQVLGINAIKATVYIPRGEDDSVRLVMYAENLGRIPPNTGLLIVKDGDENYHIRFSGDYQKNSAVILRRKR